MNEVTAVTLLFAVVGLLFVGISIPLIRGRVPPNHFYGFRTAKTLSDPRIWYEANRISGQDFFISGVLVCITSLVMLAFGQRLNPDHVVITLVSVVLLTVAGAAWHGYSVVKRM